jgi:3',5'-cyclic-AMP phosphodiesterase
MSDDNTNNKIDRRGALECMIWAGTGIVWTLSGGVPKSSRLLGLGAAQAAEKKVSGFSFLQISDSHIGFNKPANPDPLGTLKEAIGKVSGLPAKPAFMIHTGDITHLSKPGQFDDAEKTIGEANLDVHYVPGEHDLVTRTMARPTSSASERTQKAAAGMHSTPPARISLDSSMSAI